MDMTTAAVLGTGAWGTTFVQVLADAGVIAVMWGHNADTIPFINGGENPTYLPGIALSERISAIIDIAEVASGHGLIVAAVSVKAIRTTLSSTRGSLSPDAALLSLAGDLELRSLKRVDEITTKASGAPSSRIAVLSGPDLSRGITGRQPIITVVATHDVELVKEIAKACHNSYFRPYVSTDVVGAEMVGATENVIAVTIGAAEGMGLDINTHSTLITCGLVEVTRFRTALGADPATFVGLSGIGNLVVTCSLCLSRNFSLSHRMGTGVGLAETLALFPDAVEDVVSTSPILQVAAPMDVNMPITRAVVEVAEGRASIEDMGRTLLARPQKMDGWKVKLV